MSTLQYLKQAVVMLDYPTHMDVCVGTERTGTGRSVECLGTLETACGLVTRRGTQLRVYLRVLAGFACRSVVPFSMEERRLNDSPGSST